MYASTWVSSELGENDVYPDNEGMFEPAVYATLPPSWMDTAVIRTRFVPHNNVGSDYQWTIDVLNNFGTTAIEQVGGSSSNPTPITNKAPWLYDRAGVFWDAYYKTGSLKWLRAAHKASQFYAGRIRADGVFDLASWDDPKYSFSGGLIGDLIMTGDINLITTMRNISDFHVGDNWFLSNAERSWTERFFTYFILGPLSLYEATGDPSLRPIIQERFTHMFFRAKNPVGGLVPEGGLLHTKAAHGEGGSFLSEPIISPWMSALMADAAWRYYIHSEDSDALEFLAGLADNVVEHCLYTTTITIGETQEGEEIKQDFVVPYYLASGQASQAAKESYKQDSDNEHALDISGLIARGLWAKKKLGDTDTASLVSALNALSETIAYTFDKWTGGTPSEPTYRLKPPRKFNWWFGTTSDLEWLITNNPAVVEPPSLPAPSLLQATEILANTVTMTWTDNASDETAYLIEQSLDGVQYEQIAELSSNTVTFQDSNLNAGTNYFYRVRARRGSEYSSYSNTLSVTTDGGGGDPTLPAPSRLSLERAGSDQVIVTWQDNSDNETHFEIERQINGGGFAWLDRLDPNTTRYTDNTVQANTSYGYRVQAIIFQQTASNYSNVLTVTTPADGELAAPTALQVAPSSSSSLQLNWVDNAQNESNYLVERSLTNSNYQQIAELAANTIAYEDTQLLSNTTYYYRIRAKNGADFSAYSNTASATTDAEDVLMAPSGLSLTLVDNRQINLSWQDNSNNESHFEIVRQVNGGPFRWLERVSANTTNFTDRTVVPSGQYAYRVRAIIGQQEFSEFTDPESMTVPADPDSVGTELCFPVRMNQGGMTLICL